MQNDLDKLCVDTIRTRSMDAVQAHEALVSEGIRSRVVSMPSWEIFDQQPQEYRDAVLPPAVKARVAVERASTLVHPEQVAAAAREQLGRG